MNYYFKINFAGQVREVYPLFKDLKLTYEEQEGEVFYRQKCNTDFAFIAGDYDFIKDMKNFPCERIIFNIHKKFDDSIYWSGFAGYYDFIFDDDRCKATIRFSVLDKYNCILENYHKKYNLLFQRVFGLTDFIEVSEKDLVSEIPSVEYQFLFGSPTDFKITDAKKNSAGWWYNFPLTSGIGSVPEIRGNFSPGVVNPPNDDYRPYETAFYESPGQFKVFQVVTLWVTELFVNYDVGGSPNTPPGSGWVDSGFLNTINQRIWRRKPFPEKNDNDFTWQRYEFPDIGSGSKKKPNVKYEISNFPLQSGRNITYKRGLRLQSTLGYLFFQLCKSDTINTRILDSQFLNGAGFDAPVNPITQQPNEWGNVYIFQSSDIAKPDVSEQSTKMEVSLKWLLEQLKNMVDLYWDINDSGLLRIEHISFYKSNIEGYRRNRGAGIMVDEKALIGTNKYEFKREKMVSEEVFNVAEAWFPDFVGTDIFYDNICTTNRDEPTQTIRAVEVMTDLPMAQIFPTGVDLRKVFFLCDGALTRTGKFYNSSERILDETAMFLPNLPLAMSVLHNKYWRHERILLNGNMNNQETTFISQIRTVKRVEITTTLCPSVVFDPLNYISTPNWADGEVQTAEHNLKNDTIKLTLIYPET